MPPVFAQMGLPTMELVHEQVGQNKSCCMLGDQANIFSRPTRPAGLSGKYTTPPMLRAASAHCLHILAGGSRKGKHGQSKGL